MDLSIGGMTQPYRKAEYKKCDYEVFIKHNSISIHHKMICDEFIILRQLDSRGVLYQRPQVQGSSYSLLEYLDRQKDRY